MLCPTVCGRRCVVDVGRYLSTLVEFKNHLVLCLLHFMLYVVCHLVRSVCGVSLGVQCVACWVLCTQGPMCDWFALHSLLQFLCSGFLAVASAQFPPYCGRSSVCSLLRSVCSVSLASVCVQYVLCCGLCVVFSLLRSVCNVFIAAVYMQYVLSCCLCVVCSLLLFTCSMFLATVYV